MSSIGEAAAKLSEQIRDAGGGLRPEFENPEPADEAAPAQEEIPLEAEQVETDDVSDDEAREAEPESEERVQLPQTLNELAEMLGVEASDMYELEFNVDVGGEESRRFTLSELKDAATGPIRDEAERVRWSDQRRAAEAEMTAQRTALAEQRAQADAMAQSVLQEMSGEEGQVAARYQALLQDVSMQQSNPQAYQVELMRLNARLEDVRGRKQGLLQRVQQMRAQADQERQQQQEQAREAGHRKMREMVPGWDNDETFQQQAGELVGYLKQERFGVTDEELDRTLDPRVWYWAEMARRYEVLQAQAKEKPRPSPTVKLRPGAPQVRLPRGRRAEVDATNRLKQSGSIDDARAVLASRLKQAGA